MPTRYNALQKDLQAVEAAVRIIVADSLQLKERVARLEVEVSALEEQLAVLVAMAGPAWAFNDGAQREADAGAAIGVCVKSGGDQHVCALHHLPEQETLVRASQTLDFCATVRGYAANVDASCEKIRAYTKARWGY
jgi:hypothetical protein